ncbi:GNAT family N-acetyltransferase [Aeromicrobium sp.]|uniref:GNAT family N-acetyltransferase n=1 Tax=Aeromicrobium sp. TaxID=1871063 RepID=UPI0030C617AC
MLVRVALEDEYVAVGTLTVAGYDADGWLADAAPRGRDSVLLVATEGDELLGTVTWCPPGAPTRELAVEDHQGEFRTLSVAPGARRRGVGRALVSSCLDRARALLLTEVLLCSLNDMTPAHRLYESFGFVRRPELDWSPFPGVSLWAFSLEL